MSRFLFAWELGGGLGHASRLIPIANRLHADGHQVQLALKELRVIDVVPPSPGVGVMQAPVCNRVYGGLAEPPLNYAEILMRYGYLDSKMLFGLVTGWRSLIEQYGADVVIVDHSPTALLAAMTLGLRSVLLGNPFFVPPRVAPTPNMRSWVAVPPERLANSDAQVLKVINDVLARFGKTALTHIHQMFHVDDVLFLAFPELDHYGKRPDDELSHVTYFGSLDAVEHTIPPPWPAAPGKKIYAYLKPEYPHLQSVLRAIYDLGLPTIIYGLGGESPIAGHANSAAIAYSDSLIDLAQAGGDCAVAICHAGSAAGELLRCGPALLLLPSQLEQFLCANRVRELGAGVVVNPDEKSPDISGALSTVIDDPGYAENARRFAEKYRDHSTDKILAAVVGRLTAAGAPRAQAIQHSGSS